MKKFIVLCTTIALLLIFDSCQKEEFIQEPMEEIQMEGMDFKEGQMILGEQLENPYSVENMQIAYENLKSENKLKSSIKIGTTHLYVRFRPKSMQELDRITRDTTLDFFDYPLDVEIKRGGTSYHDPKIPKNEITWQYTVVPVDYTFPKVQYQKLANLFLPEQGGELQELKSAEIDHFDWLKLENEALRITNNLEDVEDEESILKSVSYAPSGNIRVEDDYLTSTAQVAIFDHWEYYDCSEENPEDPTEDNDAEPCQRAVYRYETVSTGNPHIPVEGIEVRATRWFTTYKGYTNANGSFTCNGRFTKDANYSIKWERWDFDIRSGSYGQAYYNGPKQSGPWYLNIEQSGTPKSYLFAHIFRAAHTYYYKNSQWGIKAPPRRDGVLAFLNQRLHIVGKDKPGRSHYYDFNSFWQAAQVVVYGSP